MSCSLELVTRLALLSFKGRLQSNKSIQRLHPPMSCHQWKIFLKSFKTLKYSEAKDGKKLIFKFKYFWFFFIETPSHPSRKWLSPNKTTFNLRPDNFYGWCSKCQWEFNCWNFLPNSKLGCLLHPQLQLAMMVVSSFNETYCDAITFLQLKPDDHRSQG